MDPPTHVHSYLNFFTWQSPIFNSTLVLCTFGCFFSDNPNNFAQSFRFYRTNCTLFGGKICIFVGIILDEMLFSKIQIM